MNTSLQPSRLFLFSSFLLLLGLQDLLLDLLLGLLPRPLRHSASASAPRGILDLFNSIIVDLSNVELLGVVKGVA